MNGNGKIELDEFLLLCRYIEPEIITEEEAVKLFDKLADIDGEIRSITFNNFAMGCIESNMFTSEAQMSFLGIIRREDCINQIEALIKDKTIKLIELRFKKAEEYEAYAKEWVKYIEEEMKDTLDIDASYIMFMSMKLLEAESIRIYSEKYCKNKIGALYTFTELNL